MKPTNQVFYSPATQEMWPDVHEEGKDFFPKEKP